MPPAIKAVVRNKTNSFRLMLFIISITAYGEEVQVGNDASYEGSGTYKWNVYIVADESILNSIKYVEYTLHPSFPNPIRKIYDKGSTPGKGFFIHSSGWGTFIIRVNVVFKDGVVRYLEHKLSFSDQGR